MKYATLRPVVDETLQRRTFIFLNYLLQLNSVLLESVSCLDIACMYWYRSSWALTFNAVLMLFRYKQEFGFVIPDRPILVDDVRVRGVGKTDVDFEQRIEQASGEPSVDGVRLVELALLSVQTFWVIFCRLTLYSNDTVLGLQFSPQVKFIVFLVKRSFLMCFCQLTQLKRGHWCRICKPRRLYFHDSRV